MRAIKFIMACILMMLPFCCLQAQSLDYVNSVLWNEARDIKINGNLAYLAFVNGVQVFDVADPANPRFVDKLFLQGTSYGLDLDSRGLPYLYLASLDWGMYVIDISNSSLTPLGSVSMDGECFDVVTSGDYAYTASNGPMMIYNIEDPANPFLVSSVNSAFVRKIYIHGNLAFMNGFWAIDIVDISDPADPHIISSINWRGTTAECMQGNYLYLTQMDDAMGGYLGVFDVVNPANPVLLNYLMFSTVSGPWNITVSGDYAYVADTPYSYSRPSGLRVINISDPANPVEAGQSFYPGILPFGMCQEGNYIYTSGLGRYPLQAFDISDSVAPVLTGNYYGQSDSVMDVIIKSNLAYVATQTSGLQILDVSNPHQPRLIGSYDGSCDVQWVAILGDYAYLACLDSIDLRILNISNPANPVLVGTANINGGSRKVFVTPGYAYLSSDYYNRAAIANVIDKAHPAFVRNWTTVYDMAIRGDTAYVAGFGLQIYDLSDPVNPIEIGEHFIGHNVAGLGVSGNYACLADYNAGVTIFDISNPASPDSIGFFSCTPSNVLLDGNLAYVADHFIREEGVLVYDISDPQNPAYVAGYQTPGNPKQLAVSGDYIYEADCNSLMILKRHRDVPNCPFIPGDINGNGSVNGVDIVYFVNYLMGRGAPPPIICDCGEYHNLAVAADVNGNCMANGIDVTYFVRYLKLEVPSLLTCPDCLP